MDGGRKNERGAGERERKRERSGQSTFPGVETRKNPHL